VAEDEELLQEQACAGKLEQYKREIGTTEIIYHVFTFQLKYYFDKSFCRESFCVIFPNEMLYASFLVLFYRSH
jgi:hypothetical protein